MSRLSYRLNWALLATLVLAAVCWQTAEWIPNANLNAMEEAANDDPLVVHEWGTFTELQDERGRPLPGINTDDEPVPAFVHGFGDRVITPSSLHRGKRIPFEYPQLTVRLETPVIYFYPPENAEQSMHFDVHVGLRDGWLSEYYPNARSNAPGLDSRRIESGSVGTLHWPRLRLNDDGVYPLTNESVWLQPRATRSAGITNENGESEKYLFYRGVGEFSGPIRTTTDREQGQITLSARTELEPGIAIEKIPAWIVHVKADGSLAFRAIPNGQQIRRAGYRFREEEYSAGSLDALNTQMHTRLVAAGLYSDEASAMLATWNRAYFRSPGLRIFYVVPKRWVEDQMPLRIEGVPSSIERVMVGRIELISDEQSATLLRLCSLETESPVWRQKVENQRLLQELLDGLHHPSSVTADALGTSIPRDFSAYLSLGRFRNAIVRDALRSAPTANLRKFALQYQLVSELPPIVVSDRKSATQDGTVLGKNVPAEQTVATELGDAR